MTVFEEALEFLFSNESLRYVNDPNDSGGPTKFGVTLKSYQAFVDKPVTAEEIAALTIEDVKPFFRKKYWETMSCDSIQDPAIAAAIFDCAVLYGVTGTSILVQRAVGKCDNRELKIDGIIGPKTCSILNSLNRKDFLDALRYFVVLRIGLVIQCNEKDEKYRKGWMNRADKLLTLNTDPAFSKA